MAYACKNHLTRGLEPFGFIVEPLLQEMETQTIFDMASCSKSMSTAISAMILVERGKLRLIDRVGLYLPTFEGWIDEQGKKTDIRIIDLLTHTSGLPPYAPVSELEKKYGGNTPWSATEDDLKELFGTHGQAHCVALINHRGRW